MCHLANIVVTTLILVIQCKVKVKVCQINYTHLVLDLEFVLRNDVIAAQHQLPKVNLFTIIRIVANIRCNLQWQTTTLCHIAILHSSHSSKLPCSEIGQLDIEPDSLKSDLCLHLTHYHPSNMLPKCCHL